MRVTIFGSGYAGWGYYVAGITIMILAILLAWLMGRWTGWR